ncbi:MAG TPA: ThiF family adenylyltransferase [Candidatus Limnocylindrales bacterium]
MVELTDALRLGRRSLEELADQVKIVEDWRPCADPTNGDWQLLLELTPRDLAPGNGVPASTRWFFLVDAAYPRGVIHVMPAKEGGLELTFAHQFPNTATRGSVPWRDGSMCVVETTPGHQLAIARNDPRTAEERLSWYVGRALDWLVAASKDELIAPGDPFELPYYWAPGLTPPVFVAFSEGPASFRAWTSTDAEVGVADIGIVKDRPFQMLAVKEFKAKDGRTIVQPRWGTRLSRTDATTQAFWVRLRGVPVVPPWVAPATWGALRGIARAQGLDFNRSVESIARRFRDGHPHIALIGFPMPVRRSEPASLMHWLAAYLDPLGGTFRRGPLADDAPIRWLASANWDAGQLGSRGQFEKGLAHRNVAVLGCGALGSIVAELLVRGGVTDIVVVDRDEVEAGNLARHTLGIEEIGWPKAASLAARLNEISPNVTATALGATFPLLGATDAERIRQATLIIDTTGNDQVVDAVGAFDWGVEPREFASISFSYGAERLYSYVARIGAFDPETFLAAAQRWIAADKRLTTELRWEGAGCRFPIFPARADDVNALAALAVRDLDERLLANGQYGLRVFERSSDGTIGEVFDPRTANG